MSNSHRKGYTSESKVGFVLNELKENPEVLIEKGVGVIRRIFWGKPDSKLDNLHTDFLVLIETLDEEKPRQIPVPIQVKSSERHRREFEDEMLERDMPHIKCIAVRIDECIEAVRAQVIQCLRAAVNLWKNGIPHFVESFRAFFEDGRDESNDNQPLKPRHISSKEVRRRRKEDFYYAVPCRMAH